MEETKQTLMRFMHYLNRRGFIAEDAQFDTEHQVDTFLDQFNTDEEYEK